jgi:hypothetical protein
MVSKRGKYLRDGKKFFTEFVEHFMASCYAVERDATRLFALTPEWHGTLLPAFQFHFTWNEY